MHASRMRREGARAEVVRDNLGHIEFRRDPYRARLKADPEAIADATMMHEKRITLREEKNFVEVVGGTFNVPSTLVGQP
jgi:hypothetical protein